MDVVGSLCNLCMYIPCVQLAGVPSSRSGRSVSSLYMTTTNDTYTDLKHIRGTATRLPKVWAMGVVPQIAPNNFAIFPTIVMSTSQRC